MKLLAIDTATEGCSAALLNGQQLITRMEIQPRKHAELILPMLDELLSEAGLAISQLDALAFGRGPGAFTGVRIATGVIQGIAFGADLPVIPVSTLRALAQRTYQEYQQANVLTAFDARMDEVYWASYQLADNGLMQLLGEEQVIGPADVSCMTSATTENIEWVGAGSGWQSYHEQLSQAIDCKLQNTYPQLITRAEEIAQLAAYDYEQGMAVNAENALPVYLRNKVAWKKSL